jgi:hypothetical protein
VQANEIQAWMQAVAPWVAIGATIFVAFRVQTVHRLVNSEMDKFRAALKSLAEANEAHVFQAGQQDIRDKNRETVAMAAEATAAAAKATSAAANAIKPSHEITTGD